MSDDAAEPRILILETSGRAGHVALAQGDRILHSRSLDETRRHARDLAPAVAELLDTVQWRPRDLDAVFVSSGPGSYTGLRVGIMSAKVVAYAVGAKLIGIETLEAIAAQAPADVSMVDVLADAQQGKVYVRRFIRAADGVMPAPSSALSIQPFDDWVVGRGAEAWAMGPGMGGHSHIELGRIVDPETWNPKPASLLRVGLHRLRAMQFDDPWALEPIYLRPSAAEEKWQKRGAS